MVAIFSGVFLHLLLAPYSFLYHLSCKNLGQNPVLPEYCFWNIFWKYPRWATAAESKQYLKVPETPSELPLLSGGKKSGCVFLLGRITANVMFSLQILIAIPRNALENTEYVFCGSVGFSMHCSGMPVKAGHWNAVEGSGCHSLGKPPLQITLRCSSSAFCLVSRGEQCWGQLSSPL